MKPLVSVLVPSYNHAAYIQETILSIVKQSYGYQYIQLIVVDDASNDESLELLKKLAIAYDFMLFHNKENRGVSASLNFALRQAQGEFICLCGSDDAWLLDKIEKQVAYMQAYPEATVCSGNALKIDAKGEVLPPKQQGFSARRIYSFEEILMRNFPFVTINAMIRKSVLDEVGTFNESLKVEDYDMWLRISFAGHEIHLMQDVLGYYRMHPHNTIKKVNLIYTEMLKIIAQYQTHPLYSQAKRKLDRVYFPQLAKLQKRRAIRLLPNAISNTRFFYRGLFWLLFPRLLART